MDVSNRPKLNIKVIFLILCTLLLCVGIGVGLFSLNVLPSAALEQQLRCNIAEHRHTDQCYEGDFLSCEKIAHAHDGNCYIVLLGENDINALLSLLSGEETLEYVINNVVTDALVFNENLNQAASEQVELSQETLEVLNHTISNEDSLPDLILNENINSPSTLTDNTVVQPQTETDTPVKIPISGQGTGNMLLAVGEDAVSTNYYANIYVYVDGKWTCIGTLPFTTARSGSNYNSTVDTADLVSLINESLGTTYTYDDFDVSVSSSENGSYSKSNLSVGSRTTRIGYRQSNSNARRAKYVHIIPANASATSTAFAFYSVNFVYPDGSNTTRYVRSGSETVMPSGEYEWTVGNNTYAAGEAVTITAKTTFTAVPLGPITNVNINYNVAFPAVSGVTVTTVPTVAGSTSGRLTDGFTEGAVATVRNVSAQIVQGKVNGNNTGLSRVIRFKGWRIGNTDVILQPGTTLVWEELLQYASGATINLTAEWEYNAKQTASFFIRFDSVAVDTDGNITGQDSNLYTDELYAAYVGGIDTSLSVSALHNLYHIADTTADNSFGADQEIRALYGERPEGAWLSGIPHDDDVFAALTEYARTGYLSVDGVAVKAEDLNSREYAIRWYVFKAQDDAWHIDGKLVRKEGLIHVYKTFAGNAELIGEAKSDFYITAVSEDGESRRLDPDNCTSYTQATDTYMWELSEIDYGELWEITEYPHRFEDNGEWNFYSEFTVMDAHGDQSTTGTGTSLSLSGMTYALDEGVDEVLRAEFTNIYGAVNSIVIKKQDSRTGAAMEGAVFMLLQNGKPLRFTYNDVSDSYSYDPENGTQTELTGRATGYFEISIENFSYDEGPIIIREVTPPAGYAPIPDIEIGYTDESKNIGILSGNSEMIRYTDGILIVGNSTDVLSVTAQKKWDCPEEEWQPVTLQLLASGKLVTTVLAGVEAEVVLQEDNSWSHTWNNLPVYANGQKIDWSVREVLIGREQPKADGSFNNWIVSYDLPVRTTDEEGREHILLALTNSAKRVMLRLTKTDLGKTVQLAGAEFLLEAVDESGNVLTDEIAKSGITGAAGTLIFDNLKTGVRYRLTERTPPEGFLPLAEYIYFTIQENGSVTVEENHFAESGNTAYNITVRNAAGIELPESGGGGNRMLFALGLLVMAACGIYIVASHKRRCYR